MLYEQVLVSAIKWNVKLKVVISFEHNELQHVPTYIQTHTDVVMFVLYDFKKILYVSSWPVWQ